MITRSSTAAGLSVILICAGFSARADTPTWSFKYAVKSVDAIKIPTLGGDTSEAYDINNAGQVVGYSVNYAGVEKGFLYEPYGYLQSIGTAVMAEPSYATGINNQGEVVGSWERNDKGRPFYWHPSAGFVKLSINLYPGTSYNDQFYFVPHAINDSGFIVGHADGHDFDIPYDNCHAEVPIYWPGPLADPQVLYCPKEKWGPNLASDVNNSGWIAGFEVASTDYGFVYKPNGTGGLIYLPSPDPDHKDLRVHGINAAGTLVGQAWHSGSQASLWEGPAFKYQPLGVLPGGDYSTAKEINDQNFVAGISQKGLYVNGELLAKVQRAFIWHEEFGMFDLPSPEGGGTASVCWAYALNNLKAEPGGGLVRVVGFCVLNGKRRAVRWDVHVAKQAPQPAPFTPIGR